ncbi:hypothetical protein D623_10028545 [Myotis brandtii]|uniref:Uncharacterized protein n=1 Tax=Myotis brandtii TaxID=109478 RepID=S7PD25_MYOBR|nr:hypothetical protein D623_10028545 [Myotis brandtii]
MPVGKLCCEDICVGVRAHMFMRRRVGVVRSLYLREGRLCDEDSEQFTSPDDETRKARPALEVRRRGSLGCFTTFLWAPIHGLVTGSPLGCLLLFTTLPLFSYQPGIVVRGS